MDPQVPLVVPEVNPHDLRTHHGLIANPNCSTIQMVVALKPLHDRVKIRRAVVTTFQSVSGTGQEAMDELIEQCRDLLSFRAIARSDILSLCIPYSRSRSASVSCLYPLITPPLSSSSYLKVVHFVLEPKSSSVPELKY